MKIVKPFPSSSPALLSPGKLCYRTKTPLKTHQKMPSKSKKNSKSTSSSSSSPSVSSPSPSPLYRTPKNPADTEFNENDDSFFTGALEEASRMFPSLISNSAFIGKLSPDSSSTSFSTLDWLDSNKGCKIWLSESSMVSSSIAPGSIVSVSLASRNFSSSKPLCSLAEECAISFGFDSIENLVEAPGYYFALATVFPSRKLMKNAVCLSPNLLLTMGCPASGRVVFVYPVFNQPVMRTSNGHCKFQESVGCSLSLYNCKELHLSLVSSKGRLITNGKTSSGSGLPGGITNVQDENGNIASPRTPLFPQHRHNSSSTSLLDTPNFQETRSESSHVQETSTDTLDISEIFGDDNVRKLLGNCSTSWLFSRHILCGNFVIIPILSRLCIFLALGANSMSISGDFQYQADIDNSSLISQTPDLTNYVNDAFLIDHETKVHLHLSRDSVQQTPRTTSSMTPVHEDSMANKGVDFPKLGGLDKELALLKKIIVASAFKGSLASMGLRPTKGVLLHGPPGTGKTSLAKLCALDAGLNLFNVRGPEIIGQYYGESERALNEVFDSARRALPAVVFIDELDAIAPAREQGGEELSKRIVVTLLTLMDGINRTDGLVVVAATNRLDSIDRALRRPGRFDREVEIGVPSPTQRRQILLALLSEKKHSLLDEDVQYLAGVTHGFVGADLSALCNEAALVCFRRYVSISTGGLDQNPARIACDGCSDGIMNRCFGTKSSKDDLEEISSSISELCISSSSSANGIEVCGTCSAKYNVLNVTREDFEKARMKVRPSAMREVILEVPKVRWEDIGGQREVKMQLIEAVEWPQKHYDAFKRIGTQPPTGVLMFGPPGCSKTLLARAVASEAGLNFFSVKGPELFSKWVGESEKAVKSLFEKARANAPSIIFFDEIDGLAVIRGKESDEVSVSDRVMSQLLVELDGLHQRVNVTVIAATNRPDNIDPALLRPGRFDRLLYVGPPDEKDREDIFRVHLRKKPCSSDVCIKDLALLTEGYTGADISRICNTAATVALGENFDASEITMRHFKAGIEQVKPSEARSYEGLSNTFQRLVHSIDDNTSDSQVPSRRHSRTSFWDFFRSILGFHQ